MDKIDNPDYALFQLRCLIDHHGKHFKTLCINETLETAYEEGKENRDE